MQLFRTLQIPSAHAPYAAVAGRVEREERAAESAVAAVVESIVAAESFDASRLAPLLERDAYPRAVRALQAMVPQRYAPSLARALCDATDNPHYTTRLARHFEVLPDADIIDLADLQALATGDHRAARLALAALGFIPWSGADRVCRAILALRALVRTWRARS